MPTQAASNHAATFRVAETHRDAPTRVAHAGVSHAVCRVHPVAGHEPSGQAERGLVPDTRPSAAGRQGAAMRRSPRRSRRLQCWFRLNPMRRCGGELSCLRSKPAPSRLSANRRTMEACSPVPAVTRAGSQRLVVGQVVTRRVLSEHRRIIRIQALVRVVQGGCRPTGVRLRPAPSGCVEPMTGRFQPSSPPFGSTRSGDWSSHQSPCIGGPGRC